MADLPTFRYHPDPLGSGTIQFSDAECKCCGQTRGYVYTGPVFAVEELDDSLCPWCIASGNAADKFDATFTDAETLLFAKLPEEVVEEIIRRTPGFSAWQSDQWPSCCNDACAFLGDAERSDLQSMSKTAHEVLVAGWHLTEEDFAEKVKGYEPGSSPAVYKFRCLHCNTNHFYADAD